MSNKIMSNQTHWCKATAFWATTIAERPDTTSDALTGLAAHRDVEVRKAVADNRNTPASIIMMLAQDESADLRFAIAENHNISADVLELLVGDSNPFVAHRAKKTLARILRASISVLPIAKVRMLRLQRLL